MSVTFTFNVTRQGHSIEIAFFEILNLENS